MMLSTARRSFVTAAVLAVSVAVGGCVRSNVQVTSNPPDADIHMNGLHMGETPVEMPFIWYWYYDFTAEKEGFEGEYQRVRFRPPWYLVPPLDLVMEAMPFPVRDTKHVHFDLRPLDRVPAPEFVPAAEAPASGEATLSKG